MSEVVDFSGRYNSTYDFVRRLNLDEKAKELWGADWEAEFDAEQISELTHFLNQNYYYVSVLEHVDEDDILVTKIDGLVELDKYKKAYNILMDYYDSISDEEKPIVDKQLSELGL